MAWRPLITPKVESILECAGRHEGHSNEESPVVLDGAIVVSDHGVGERRQCPATERDLEVESEYVCARRSHAGAQGNGRKTRRSIR